MRIKIISIFLIIVGIVIGKFNANFVIGMTLVLLGIYILLEKNLMKLIKGVQQTGQRNNCKIELKINIEEILNDEISDYVFDELQKNKDINKSLTKKEWKKNIIQNYKKKYQKEDSIEDVTFNIKDTLLLKNNEIEYNDTIFHEILIPYKADEKEGRFFGPKITAFLTIRILMVNGLIKLQVGDFTKDYSPEVIEKGLDTYKTFYTITAFPFMYVSQAISKDYLNLNIWALDSYFNNQKQFDDTFKEDKNINTDYFKEWKSLAKEIKDYEYMNFLNPDDAVPNQGKFTKILTNFRAKSAEMLESEDFKNPYARDTSDDDYYTSEFLTDTNVLYSNKYLTIFIANFNDYKDHNKKHGYTDYWEETP